MATHADSSANDVALCQAADEPELLEPTIAEPGIFKTEICARWLKGDCGYGSGCQFAHGVHEIRERARPRGYKTQICQKFLSSGGRCRYGQRCNFLHALLPNGETSQSIDKRARACKLRPSSDSSFASSINQSPTQPPAASPSCPPLPPQSTTPSAAPSPFSLTPSGAPSPFSLTPALQVPPHQMGQCWPAELQQPSVTSLAPRSLAPLLLQPPLPAYQPTPLDVYIKQLRATELRVAESAAAAAAQNVARLTALAQMTSAANVASSEAGDMNRVQDSWLIDGQYSTVTNQERVISATHALPSTAFTAPSPILSSQSVQNVSPQHSRPFPSGGIRARSPNIYKPHVDKCAVPFAWTTSHSSSSKSNRSTLSATDAGEKENEYELGSFEPPTGRTFASSSRTRIEQQAAQDSLEQLAHGIAYTVLDLED